MYKLQNICILTFWLALFIHINNCQIDDIYTKPVKSVKTPINRKINTTIVRGKTKSIPSVTTNGFFNKNRSPYATPIISDSQENIPSSESISNAEANFNNTTTIFKNTTLTDDIIEKNINWTSGFGTHYGPFPSNPHFSEVGYQPNDVGVGCSDGRPGGDPKWSKILAKGVYPAPNIVNHERTVWPVAYTVAVSAAVWNKDDICWKTLKIRNKNKPEKSIEAYIVDFCPIGYCQWKDKYLARNVDIYGEKAWLALGADVNESNLEIEIEWPKGVIPHDAIKLSGADFSMKCQTLIAIAASFISVLITIFML